LSESSIFLQGNEGFGGKYRELRTFISLHAESPALKALAFRVWKLWKRRGDSDTESDNDHFKLWLEEIRTPTLWGGSTELILFAATFGIHVISVEQVEETINLSTTTDAFAQLRIRPSIRNKPGFGTKPPSNINEVIFYGIMIMAIQQSVVSQPIVQVTITLYWSYRKSDTRTCQIQHFISVMIFHRFQPP
jgi:hypothetical protein